MKLVHHEGMLFATVKANGAFALTVYGAAMLSRSPRFRQNCVHVSDDAVQFVKGGKSVFCKFVSRVGKDVRPRGEVAVVDGKGRVVGVGTAVLSGAHMALFKSGVAVKVRAGLEQ
ncbi:MAG: queuine tRNA-ribosyltransferase [Nitrososphaerota archaeon]|nr:queuine tRNA-ribosyltransferase [Nitrososphaerota archaeon]